MLATDGSGSWSPAVLNMPVTSGARLATENGSRTELHSGWSAFRLSGKSELEITELDDDGTRLALTSGTLSARVRELQQGERFEIGTPNIALVANQPGEYRFDVDPRSDTTRLSIHKGSATVYGEAGQSVNVGAGEQLILTGRSLGGATRGIISYRDTFDQWVASRDVLDDRSASARYVSPGVPGYQQLDAYGDWNQDATHGAVWFPRVSDANWAPYRDGQWRWVDPWGWTWVDAAPWGFAPFHYGRWAQIGPRWAWVPGPVVRRPVYSPALVGFMGGTSGDTSWGISLGNGGPGAAWFPLAPGEYWEPGYRASPRYMRALNPWANSRVPPRGSNYFFQRHPNAISVVARDQFGIGEGRRPRFTDGSRLPPGQWNGARIVPPPPRPNLPGISGPRNPGSGYFGAIPNRSSPMPAPGYNAGGDRPYQPGFENRRPGGQPQMGDDRSRESQAWRIQQQQEQHRFDRQRDQQQQMERERGAQQLREQQVIAEQQRAMRDHQQRQIQQQREQQQQQHRQFQQQQEQRQQLDHQRQAAQQQQNQWREQQQQHRQQMEQQRQSQQRPQPMRPGERPGFQRPPNNLAGQD